MEWRRDRCCFFPADFLSQPFFVPIQARASATGRASCWLLLPAPYAPAPSAPPASPVPPARPRPRPTQPSLHSFQPPLRSSSLAAPSCKRVPGVPAACCVLHLLSPLSLLPPSLHFCLLVRSTLISPTALYSTPPNRNAGFTSPKARQFPAPLSLTRNLGFRASAKQFQFHYTLPRGEG